jgi:enoyl-CoA hydratase/carnithine racemase
VSDVVTERHGSVLLCRLARPEQLNGLTGPLLNDFLAVLGEARVDDTVRVVVTTGDGEAFSAGAVVEALTGDAPAKGLSAVLQENLGVTASLPLADRTFDRLGIGREALAIAEFEKPLIAAVNGAAAGGGLALAMLHDLRIVSDKARFTTAFAHLGLAVEMGLSYTLPRAIGLEAAMDLVLTGRLVDAEEALRLRLVGRVVPHERLLAEAMACAERLASRAPIAVQFAKRALVRSWDNDFRAQLELEWPYQVAAFATADAREGIAAFREKRPPRFRGQ